MLCSFWKDQHDPNLIIAGKKDHKKNMKAKATFSADSLAKMFGHGIMHEIPDTGELDAEVIAHAAGRDAEPEDITVFHYLIRFDTYVLGSLAPLDNGEIQPGEGFAMMSPEDVEAFFGNAFFVRLEKWIDRTEKAYWAELRVQVPNFKEV